MAFTLASIFSSPLQEGAERYARDAASSSPGPAIIYEIGWNTLILGEEEGGYGGTFTDLAAVIEGLAGEAINLPLITRCGIIPAILNALGNLDKATALRTGLASGDVRMEWAGALAWWPVNDLPRIHAARDGRAVSGLVEPVELTEDCTHVMLAAVEETNQDIVLLVLEAGEVKGFSTAYASVEGRATRCVRLECFPLEDDAVLAREAAARNALMTGWQVAQALVCTDIVCSMNRALGETITYLQERKQFGQALAGFQALRHDVARLYVNFEACKGLLISSIRLLEDHEQARSVENVAAFELLGLQVRDQAVEFAQSVIQLHGGMGMTRETLAARLATRMIALAFRFGDAYSHTKSLITFQGAQK